MESSVALVCLFAYLHCALSRLTARLLMVFIKPRSKTDFDIVDSKNQARYLAHHYPAGFRR